MNKEQMLKEWASEKLKGQWVGNDERTDPPTELIMGQNIQITEVEDCGLMDLQAPFNVVGIPNEVIGDEITYHRFYTPVDSNPLWFHGIYETKDKFFLVKHNFEDNDAWGKELMGDVLAVKEK